MHHLLSMILLKKQNRHSGAGKKTALYIKVNDLSNQWN